jgi:hypothetical protein
MSLAPAHQIPPLDEYLGKSAPIAHRAVIAVYNKLQTDQSVGKTRAQSQELGGWGATTQRSKEQSGVLLTWVDGTIVRVSTVSIYLHLIDLIVASHPVDGPPRKARTPSGSYQKGHRRVRKAQEAETANAM